MRSLYSSWPVTCPTKELRVIVDDGASETYLDGQFEISDEGLVLSYVIGYGELECDPEVDHHPIEPCKLIPSPRCSVPDAPSTFMFYSVQAPLVGSWWDLVLGDG